MQTHDKPTQRGVLFTSSLVSLVLALGLAGCDAFPPLPKKASDWVSFVNWDEATRIEITAEEESADHFHFVPADVTFEAGKPYILKMVSPASNGEKHYFHTDGFYKAIATRKAQTVDAEYKAPYFDDFELLTGGSIELYFVPVIAGTYDMWCTVPGHRELGMEGTWTITGGAGFELDLEVAPDFDMALATDERRSGSHPVWQEGALATQTVTLTEYAFEPNEYTLLRDVGYRLTLVAPTTNAEKHYHTAAELYKTVVTRKGQDSQAEIKVPYFKAIELLVGGSTDLYIVPTVPGAYELICTVPGHAELGMTGTITVEDKVSTPVKASDWVSFVNWDEAKRVTVIAHEESPENFHLHPELTFEAGKPYILVMSNPEVNSESHYFHAPDFFKSISTRKAQTSDAEYKAPYFDDFELLTGGTLELFFVPVIAGTYEMWCTKPGHREFGLETTLTITGGEGFELDLEVASDFNEALATDERRSGDHEVWQEGALATQTVTLTEYEFIPNEYTLAMDVAYKLTLVAPTTNAEKHYHTAAELYKTVVTRKGQDSQAEIKVPYFKAIELLVGGSTDLYIVPTVPGAYDLICTVPGHAELGMTGTIFVE